MNIFKRLFQKRQLTAEQEYLLSLGLKIDFEYDLIILIKNYLKRGLLPEHLDLVITKHSALVDLTIIETNKEVIEEKQKEKDK